MNARNFERILKRGWPTTIKTFRIKTNAAVRDVYIDRASSDRILL
jgi:hypothetical protein